MVSEVSRMHEGLMMLWGCIRVVSGIVPRGGKGGFMPSGQQEPHTALQHTFLLTYSYSTIQHEFYNIYIMYKIGESRGEHAVREDKLALSEAAKGEAKHSDNACWRLPEESHMDASLLVLVPPPSTPRKLGKVWWYPFLPSLLTALPS